MESFSHNAPRKYPEIKPKIQSMDDFLKRLETAKKIIVCGSPGSGKTVFSSSIAAYLGIELYHLDSLYWRANWDEPSLEEWQGIENNILEKQSWIMDGHNEATLLHRLHYADLCIFLDEPPQICAGRVLRRWAKHWSVARPEMHPTNRERLDIAFLTRVALFRRRKITRLIRSGKSEYSSKVFILRNSRLMKRKLDQRQSSTQLTRSK
ncbi:MAG: hypothetical protein AAFR71_09940 [Pseudomonadota bacterium]